MNNNNQIKLTEYSRGSGCGCKISPALLREILHSNEDFPIDPRLVVGYNHSDDAAVFQWEGDSCLISTTDFFMPVVDDAYEFGRIAAANALSDVYAMGGRPLMALAILGWPVDKLPASLAARVLEGARFICRMAGISLAGGHSIDSVEPVFGLAVNGTVKSNNLKRNNTARPGDLLFLTKPLGTGIISAAQKRGLAKAEHLQTAISYMCSLNKVGEVLGSLSCISALTDVTGFGLLGHLLEMCDNRRLTAVLDFADIAILPGAKTYIDQFVYPDMTMKNFSAYGSECTELSAERLFILCDPQTSGGLLVAVSPDSTDEYLQVVNNFGLQGIADRCIGSFVPHGGKTVFVI